MLQLLEAISLLLFVRSALMRMVSSVLMLMMVMFSSFDQLLMLI